MAILHGKWHVAIQCAFSNDGFYMRFYSAKDGHISFLCLPLFNNWHVPNWNSILLCLYTIGVVGQMNKYLKVSLTERQVRAMLYACLAKR